MQDDLERASYVLATVGAFATMALCGAFAAWQLVEIVRLLRAW